MSASRQPGKGAAPLVSERREEILALAAKIFADKGYASTTVREIADSAGILSGSLYHHFDSKEAMLDEIMHGFLDHIVAQYRATVAAGGDPLDVLRALVREAFSSLGGNPAALAVMINELKAAARSRTVAMGGRTVPGEPRFRPRFGRTPRLCLLRPKVLTKPR